MARLTDTSGLQFRDQSPGKSASMSSRSEERGLHSSAPWMKMMHLMINRRQAPNKKTSLVKESLHDGLATFKDSDRQAAGVQILKHPPPCRSYKSGNNYVEPPVRLSSPRNCGDEAVRRKDFEINSLKEAANRVALEEANRDANGDREDGSSMKTGHHRAGSMESIRLGPASLSCKENRLGDESSEKLAPELAPELELADDSWDEATGRFAYISLDGRLINAELATSATSIGGGLGDEEAQAWGDFAPMQRVLIVAVSAAAAAAAKHRNGKEIDLLLKTVENRENELLLLRQQLSELCNILPEPLRERSVDGGNFNTKVQRDLHEACSPAWSSTKPAHVRARPGGDDDDDERLPVTPRCRKAESSLVSSKLDFQVGDEAWANGEAKWYVNPMVETCQDEYNISTPERSNSMFLVCNPAVQGSFEWAVLRSSFATRDTRLPLVESPLPKTSPIQATVSNWSTYQPKSSQQDRTLHLNEPNAMRAVCAAFVLDLREQMLTVLDKEASTLMAALDNLSVEDAKTQMASMQLGVARCWNASVPKALAALSLSPFEFDSYLNDTQGASIWSDAYKFEESVVAWRRYLETIYGAKVPSEGKTRRNIKWSSVERTVADERLTTTTSSACPRGGGQDEDILKLGSQSGCPKSSAAELTEQLIRELDKAAAKVAVMERQMKKLEQDVAGCDDNQISKPAECSKQDLENQVKGGEDVAELVRQLHSKEVEVAELKKGQQNLKRKIKTRKIEEENILCPMASPKGYGAIYWERAAGQKKTKFHAEPGEFKTRSNPMMTSNEPKALVDCKKKEIGELKEDHQRHNAERDKEFAAAETAKAATADRLAMLEELCKQKDSTLSYLKQDIQSLELKVHGSRVHQSPALPRAQRNSTSSSTPSSSSGGNIHGTSQSKQRFSDKYASSSPSGSTNPILEHIGRFRRNAQGHYRNLHHMNIPTHEELSDDGRSDQESTIGDDCSGNSHALSEMEVESRLGSEYCSSGDDSSYRISTKGFSSYNRTSLPKQFKSVSSDLRRAVTSTSRILPSATSTSKTVSGEKHSTKCLNRRSLSGEPSKKPITDPNSARTVSNLKV